jgi:putative oxygen-independent coproporphyrinogen III oxidase
MTALLRNPPLSLYVHMPWCVRKCPYCDFNSHAAPAQIPYDKYIDALLADLDLDCAAVKQRSLTSIFFGGGTPSLFAPELIGKFLEGVRTRLPCAVDMEVTLETNPGTVEHGRFAGYRDAGVNRVSLGAQTFNASQLQTLGRIHGADEIRRAVDELNTAGLINFNLDLMYGLPAQTLQQALDDVEAAIALGPQHLSHYQLTLEPGTVFYHRPPPLPGHDETWEMQLACQSLLREHGFSQYEISGYAQARYCCQHNLNYWQYGDYLGIGAGAHGKITNDAESDISRTIRVSHPHEYLARPPEGRVLEQRRVGDADRAFEFMLNALRLRDGFSISQFEERTGLATESIAPQLQRATLRGLLAPVGDERWQPTEIGFRFLNELQEIFLPKDIGSH